MHIEWWDQPLCNGTCIDKCMRCFLGTEGTRLRCQRWTHSSCTRICPCIALSLIHAIASHQLRTEDLVLTQRDTPCAGLPHWSGKLRSQVIPHTPAVQERWPREFASEGHVVLQEPQKLGSVCRLAQKGPELVAQACTGGLGFTHVTVQAPAVQQSRSFNPFFPSLSTGSILSCMLERTSSA